MKFIDLFSGIGGFHLAFHNQGADCVMASELDPRARLTYERNFHRISPDLFSDDCKLFPEDVTKIDKESVPDHDVLCGGFPCQPFSQAGRKDGFGDVRGTLFFDIAEILWVKRPRAFFLENVRHLYKHDDGRTFSKIRDVLSKDLGYSFQEFIVKASDHGLPQHRPRLFMIGFSDGSSMIDPPDKSDGLRFTMSDVMGGSVDRDVGFTLRVGGRGSGVGDRRNWDCYVVDGEEHRLTSDEGKMMQGFPESFSFPVSESAAMKQLGNSVAVPAVEAYAKSILSTLRDSS